jgi:hypothetical protein
MACPCLFCPYCMYCAQARTAIAPPIFGLPGRFGGGIPPYILPFLQSNAFTNKGLLSALPASIPVHVILRDGRSHRGRNLWFHAIDDDT